MVHLMDSATLFSRKLCRTESHSCRKSPLINSHNQINTVAACLCRRRWLSGRKSQMAMRSDVGGHIARKA